jgi:hypothetical protein
MNTKVYRISKELRSLLRDLIPELILSQKRYIHMGPIRNGSGVNEFLEYRLHTAEGSLVTRVRKCNQADGEHFEQFAWVLNG